MSTLRETLTRLGELLWSIGSARQGDVMTLTQYRSGKPLALLGYWWARKTWRGTLVNYGRTFRVRESPEEIDRLDKFDDEQREAKKDIP